MNTADRSCTLDDDCVITGHGLSCVSDCGVTAAVSASAEAGVASAVQVAEHELCSAFTRNACPRPVALPCTPPLPRSAVCRSGRCEIVTDAQ